MEKFRVGDVIVLEKSFSYREEVGREQIVMSVNDDYYYAKFLDNGYKNNFGCDCEYAINCYLVRSSIIENNIWENGIPMVWEGEL